jgi:hypothetical protein
MLTLAPVTRSMKRMLEQLRKRSKLTSKENPSHAIMAGVVEEVEGVVIDPDMVADVVAVEVEVDANAQR